MSAPDTNAEKQVRRHRGSLWGIAAAVLVAAVLFLGYMMVVLDRNDAPTGAEAQVDGRTGAIEETR